MKGLPYERFTSGEPRDKLSSASWTASRDNSTLVRANRPPGSSNT